MCSNLHLFVLNSNVCCDLGKLQNYISLSNNAFENFVIYLACLISPNARLPSITIVIVSVIVRGKFRGTSYTSQIKPNTKGHIASISKDHTRTFHFCLYIPTRAWCLRPSTTSQRSSYPPCRHFSGHAAYQPIRIYTLVAMLSSSSSSSTMFLDRAWTKDTVWT